MIFLLVFYILDYDYLKIELFGWVFLYFYKIRYYFIKEKEINV